MQIEIIAELAQGFEGNPQQSRLLMRAAATAKADAAKYQLVYADELATPDYKYYELFRTLEMSDETWAGLAQYANELGIKLYVDVFGVRSLRLAEQIGVSTVKLHGTDISNVAFLKQVAGSSVPRVLLGAGGAFATELESALEILGDKHVVVLLGFQGYPTSNEANQIARVRHLCQRFEAADGKLQIGFADHAPPNNALRYALAATAVGAGARVVEKHLTLAQVMKLEDYESALNPDEFMEFCDIVRSCFEANGTVARTDDFGMHEGEVRYRNTIRRHVVTSRALSSGMSIEPRDVLLKRTSATDAMVAPEAVYGKRLKCDLAANVPVLVGDIE